MAENDKPIISIDIDPSIPPDVWKDVASVLIRIFGPIAELSDLLSERIRFFRFKSAVKVLHRANEISEKSGVELKPLPVKFLVPLLEKCSLEEEDSDLTEQWARLLVSASSGYNPQHPVFVDILSQIGPYEAQLLKHIWKRQHKSGFDKLVSLLDVYAEETRSYYGGELRVSLDEEEAAPNKFMIMAGSMPEKRSQSANASTDLQDQNIQSLLVLERQNLIKIKAVKGPHETKERKVFVGPRGPHSFGLRFCQRMRGCIGNRRRTATLTAKCFTRDPVVFCVPRFPMLQDVAGTPK